MDGEREWSEGMCLVRVAGLSGSVIRHAHCGHA